MGERLTERRRFWRDHLLACHDSGLTMKAYAEGHGLKLGPFYGWKRKLARLGLLERDAPVAGGALVPVRVAPDLPSADRCRIELPSGIRVDWPLAGDAGRLVALLQVLEGDG